MILRALPLAALLGCHADPLDAVLDDADWGLRASDVTARLDIPCAGATGGTGRYDVALDDHSGWTALLERDTDRIWLRDPFGVLPDRCWWMPEGSAGSLERPCFDAEGQDGTCTDGEPIDGWSWHAPGLARSYATIDEVVAVDGTLLALVGSSVQRLDLTPSDHQPVDDSENRRTFGTWLDAMVGPDLHHLAVGEAEVVGHADDAVWAWPRERAVRGLSDGTESGAPSGEGVLAAGGDWAVLGTDRLDVYHLGRDERSRIRHPALRDIRAVAITPLGTPHALVEDAVLAFGQPVRRYPTPGAEGLALGRPAEDATVYAWGNDGGTGVIYRLDGDTSTAWRLDAPLLGFGVGETFQELVLVLDRDGPVVESWLDRAHVDAIPDGTLGLALAVFAETPRDAELGDGEAAASRLAFTDCVEGDTFDTVCCVQGARGDFLAAQLDWLATRLDRTAVVLGVNPTVVAQSHLCTVLGGKYATWGATVPTALSDFYATHDVGAAVLLHSSPYKASSGWVGCPDDWEPDGSCWDVPVDDASYRAFYADLAAHASLAPWGSEPDWSLLGGGFDGAHVPGAPDWTEVFPSTPLPDGAAADGLFFGSLSMAPAASDLAGKELAPDDATARVFPVAIGSPAAGWDTADPIGATYWPGETFALPWLHERRRSGLLFRDFDQIVSGAADWSDPAFRGDEDADRMTHADFAVARHWLLTRVLAHRNATEPRWTYIHVGDLSKLRPSGLHEGWIDCDGSCDSDTELDRFLDALDAWPAVTWRRAP